MIVCIERLKDGMQTWIAVFKQGSSEAIREASLVKKPERKRT
jgi:hypothetical protein